MITAKELGYKLKDYSVNTLLSKGSNNAKIKKSDNSGAGVLTYIQHLAPAKVSGFEVCPKRSAGCSASCLYSAGHGRFNSVQQSRINRTRLLFLNKCLYEITLYREIKKAKKRAEKLGKKLAIRLNGTSDIVWEKTLPYLFNLFPDVVFYDYTKIAKRFADNWNLPSNYHLIFSRSESNDSECLEVLKNGGNVAVVFSGPLPSFWNGYRVIDGDKTDLRFLDEKNVVVGLSAKGAAKKDRSGFVVQNQETS